MIVRDKKIMGATKKLLIESFVKQTPTTIALIRKGVIEGDFELASSLSKRLSSTSIGLGARKLASIFCELEAQFNCFSAVGAAAKLNEAEIEFESVRSELIGERKAI